MPYPIPSDVTPSGKRGGRVNDAHHWRRANDAGYVNRSSPRRPVNVLVSALNHHADQPR